MFQTDYSGCRHNKNTTKVVRELKIHHSFWRALSMAQTKSEAESVVCKMTVICPPPHPPSPLPPLLGTRFSFSDCSPTIIPGSESQCLCHFLCNCGHWHRGNTCPSVNVFSITLCSLQCLFYPPLLWPVFSWACQLLNGHFSHIFYFHDNCHWPAQTTELW